MALPRTKVQIQNQWVQWLDDKAVEDGLTAQQKADIKILLAQEVSWMIYTPLFEEDLAKRLAKFATLLAANEDDLTIFEPYWNYRLQFLQWMQT